MLSHIAAAVVPVLGHLTISSDRAASPTTGKIIVANHTSLADPGVVLAALRRMEIEPVILATAGLWRVPVLGRLLNRDGHIPVHRRTAQAADSLEAAAQALAAGRDVLIYGEGRLPLRKDSAEAAPEHFRSGPARLAAATNAPILPLGQVGARRITSGSRTKQLAGIITAPARRPRLHVHLGAPLHLPTDIPTATAMAQQAVTAAWRTAAERLGEPAALAAVR